MNQKKIWNELYKNNKDLWSKETKTLPTILKNKNVLEIGVGNGKTLTAILKQKPSSVTAIDFSQEAINQCKIKFNQKNIFLKNESITSFKSKEKFDIVVCYYVFNNLTDEEIKSSIKNLQSILAKNGRIIFEDFAVGDFRQNSKEKIIKKSSGLKHRFFTIQDLKYFFKSFLNISLELRESTPIRSLQDKKRRIISGIISY